MVWVSYRLESQSSPESPVYVSVGRGTSLKEQWSDRTDPRRVETPPGRLLSSSGEGPFRSRE